MNIIFGLFSEGILLRSHKKSKILGKSREFGEWVLRKVLGMGWFVDGFEGWYDDARHPCMDLWRLFCLRDSQCSAIASLVTGQIAEKMSTSERYMMKYVLCWSHSEWATREYWCSPCVTIIALVLLFLTSEVELYIIPQANLQIGGRDCHRQRHRSHASLTIGNECVPELSLNAKSYPLMVWWFLFLVCSPFLFYVRGL